MPSPETSKARLIALTLPAIPECNSLEQLITYCARVSNPSNQSNHQTSSQLLRYLLKHRHWSPFEMVSLTLELTTTRDIARQVLRHRSFSFQELSQRYTSPLPTICIREARLQHPSNRQASLGTDDPDLQEWWSREQAAVAILAQGSYQSALSRGIAKEVARSVLPEGLTPSTLYMAGTLRSWIHYLQLRTKPETQKEHRDLACACTDAIRPHFPSLGDLL